MFQSYRRSPNKRFLVYFALLGLLAACVPTETARSPATQASIKPTSVAITLPPPETAVSHPTPTPPTEEVIQNKRLDTAVSSPLTTRAPLSAPAAEDQLYHLPLDGEMNVDWLISNYVDQDWEAYQSNDYRQGNLTYDGHTGTDFLLRDLAKMEEGVAVLAARAGTVVELHDAANDAGNIDAETNFITIEHADGSKALYQHLQQGSTQVTVGDFVSVGQPIALIGNSGNSLNPHLHFEVRSANGRLIDIFNEGLTAFDYPYPDKPYVFQAGVTRLSDPALQNDMFRYTPNTLTVLPATASPAFWFKAVNVQAQDRLHSVLVYPDGTEQALFTLQANQNQAVVSWYIYANPLPPGWYSVWYFFNDEVASSQSLSFQVVR